MAHLISKNLRAVIFHPCKNFIRTITETKIKVDDFNLNYVKCGSGDKTVLLLSGVLGHARVDLKPQIEGLPKLLKNYTIIALDPPGYGKSIPPNRTYTIDFYRNDSEIVMKFMKQMNVEKFSLLGWSDGGIVGLITAANNTNTIEKLCVWGVNSYVVKSEVESYEKMSDFKNWSARAREPLIATYGEEYAAKAWSEWVKAMKTIYDQRNGDLCKNDLKLIKCPTFLLHGEKDPMVDPQHVPYLLKEIKNAKLYSFPEGKHNIHLKYAEEFNKLVANFLNN